MTTAIVLPPHEGFSPQAVGAVGLLVHRLVRAGAEGTVIGVPTTYPAFVDVPFMPASPGWGFSRAARYVQGVTRVLRQLRPRSIEVHNRPEVALGLADRFRGTPILLWLHNDPQDMRRMRSLAERTALLARMSRVVAVSEWISARLPVQATVLPNCIDLPDLGEVAREDLILFAGRPVADKGADSFVAACAEILPQLPGWRAQIIGAGRFMPGAAPSPFERRLVPAAAAAGVEMLGHQPHAAVMEAMQRAAIVAVPSRWQEPFGLTALEALACGAALVCSDRGGLPEVAGDAAVYADPDRPGALAAALLAVAKDPARRVTLGQVGRSRAQRFGAAEAAQALNALRAEILS